MGRMLLCRNQKAKQPYFVEELGLNLYSGEELSYYIYHNALLIGENFLDERLFRFISQELGMTKLEAKLRRWADQADLSELLLVILQDIHYYNADELRQFRSHMAEVDRMTPGQRKLVCAEELLSKQRYAEARLQYERLLYSGDSALANEEFQGKAWLGRGIVCARQYDWMEASKSLAQAYALLPQDHVGKMLYCAACQLKDDKWKKEFLEQLEPEKQKVWDQEIGDAKKQSRFLGRGQEVSEWMDKDNIRKMSGLRQLVENWKTDYRRHQGG